MKQKKNYNLLIGAATLLAIVTAVSLIGYAVSRPEPALIQGQAEATEYRISGKVPGRVERFCVSEGDHVRKGDTLVIIDSPETRARLAQAEALKATAEAQEKKAVAGAREEETAAAYELWQKAMAGEEIARKAYDRAHALYAQKVISAQKHDEAEAQYQAARSTCAAAKSQYEMAVKGAREEDKAAAAALVKQAAAALAEVESYLGELCLTSPADGIVSARFPKTGELVGQGAPIMAVTDLDDVWFTFNIREDMLKGMKTGDRLSLSIPALGMDNCVATVTYISVLESYATWRATRDTGSFDARTFEVRAVPQGPIEGIRPGMTAILTQRITDNGERPCLPE